MAPKKNHHFIADHPSLLIVDDSRSTRLEINGICEKTGRFSTIYQAKDNAEAIETVKSVQPNIITMDLTLPNINGVETIAAIREISKETRILVITGSNDIAETIESLEKGACGIIQKPFSNDELYKAIELILQ